MNTKFDKYIAEKGVSLKGMNLNENAVALEVLDALNSLELIDNPILGGDFLTQKNCTNLSYIVHEWGYDYHYLNWYSNQKEGESLDDFKERSQEEAKSALHQAYEVSVKLERKCYVVLVLKDIIEENVIP